MRFAREGSQITHSVIACSSTKRCLMLWGESAQRSIAAGAATTDHEALRVGVPIRYQMASTVDTVLERQKCPTAASTGSRYERPYPVLPR